MKLDGKCVVCQKYLSEADYDRQAVVALIGPEGTVVACVAHLQDYPNGQDYLGTIRRMAEAKAGQLGIFN